MQLKHLPYQVYHHYLDQEIAKSKKHFKLKNEKNKLLLHGV
jgi:hypothetical protein